MVPDSSIRDFVVPSKEIEAMSFAESPELCSHFFRASKLYSDNMWLCSKSMDIVARDSPSSEYYLTGINLDDNDQSNQIYLPKNANIARIGSRHLRTRYNEELFTKFHILSLDPEPINFGEKKFAYPVHAHCWALLDQTSNLTL